MAVGDNKLDIFNTAERVLASINQTFAEYDEVLPTRQFIYVGESPPHDCEQLVVGFVQHYSGAPGAQAQEEAKCNDPRTATFRVELVRTCAPGLTNVRSETTNQRYSNRLEVPAPELYTADAQKKLIDATLMMEAGMRVVGPKHSFLGGMASVQVGPVSGGYQATILEVVMVVE